MFLFSFLFLSPCHFRGKKINKCRSVTFEKNYWWLWDGQLLFSPNQLKTSNPEVLCKLQGSEGSLPLSCCTAVRRVLFKASGLT